MGESLLFDAVESYLSLLACFAWICRSDPGRHPPELAGPTTTNHCRQQATESGAMKCISDEPGWYSIVGVGNGVKTD